MTYDEWVTQGRPHWQCEKCKGIYVTIPQPDDFMCPICTKPTGPPNERFIDHFGVAMEKRGLT